MIVISYIDAKPKGLPFSPARHSKSAGRGGAVY